MANELKYKLSLQDLFTPKMNGAVTSTQKLDTAMSGLGSKLRTVLGTVATAALAKSVIETTAKFQSFDNAIKTASGSAAQGQKNLAFLNEQVDRLGLDINAAYAGYKTFSGALMGTALEGDKANTVFRQVSEAATVMGLSGEQTEGAFLALGQMMSKGTVSAEELRGQLGERIPGAFQIAARAMGVTTMQLGEMMKKGEVVSEEFLPKFGAELERTFGGKVANSTNSLQSNLNRLNTEWERLKVTLGTEFLPEILKAVSALTKFLKENKDLIITGIKWAAVIGSVTLAVKAGMMAYNGITTAISLMTTANAALNLSLGTTLGTVGLLTAAFVAMGIAIYGAISAYNEWQDVKSGKGRLDTKTGMDDEIKSVTALADRYTQLGRSREEAMKTAITQERKSINQDISSLESQLATATGDRKGALERQIQYRKGQLTGLIDEGGLVREYASNKTMASANSAKAGGTKSSSSIGSSTEVSGARPQNLIINIHDGLVKSLTVQGGGGPVQNWAQEVRRELTKALTETLNDANQTNLAVG